MGIWRSVENGFEGSGITVGKQIRRLSCYYKRHAMVTWVRGTNGDGCDGFTRYMDIDCSYNKMCLE